MTHSRRYAVVILLTVLACAVEFVGHAISNGLGLLSDALHLLGDSVPLFLGLAFVVLGQRGRDMHAYESSIPTINASVLLAFAIWIAFDAYRRFLSPEPVATTTLLYAGVGTLLNGLKLYFGRGLTEAHHHPGTSHSQILHLAADFVGSVAVLLGSFFVVLLMVMAAVKVLRGIYRENAHQYH